MVEPVSPAEGHRLVMEFLQDALDKADSETEKAAVRLRMALQEPYETWVRGHKRLNVLIPALSRVVAHLLTEVVWNARKHHEGDDLDDWTEDLVSILLESIEGGLRSNLEVMCSDPTLEVKIRMTDA